nr:hypothetical protein [Pleurocapsa sp. MO_192.B19]
YSELCTHANLYQTEINSPVAYKNFLDKYKERGYRNDSLYLQELTIQDELIPLKYLGVNLSPESDLLYVVGDRLNSLSLRNFLRSGEKYIYRSVYHYWNSHQQIANHLDINNSVVFIDLHNLSEEPYCSLKFKSWSNTIYQIPIIDNRSEASNNFKLPLDIKEIHHNIYRALTKEILYRNFPQLASNQNTIEHLELYLQKIEVFRLARTQNISSDFSLVIEILDSQKIYYKSINLDVALLEDIVINKIDIKAIAQLTQRYPEYTFILISDYNFLPKFKKALINDNIFIPDNRLNEFPRIWQEKQQHNFPLFGQYLDKIKFQIQQDGKQRWIEVLSENQDRIYYENESGKKKFIARIQETGQEYFKLSYPHNVLPIKINEKDYYINENIQEYKIIHPYSEAKAKSEELIVRIEFIVELGSVPQLRVKDAENKCKIESNLCDREEIVRLLGYIPLNTILENRRNKNSFVPSPEKVQKFIDALSPIKNIDSFNTAMRFNRNIWRAYEIIKRNNNNPDLFINLDCNHSSVENIKEAIINFNTSGTIDELRKYIQGQYNFQKKKAIETQNFIETLIIFLGKTYRLSEHLNLNSFFEPTTIELACKNKQIRKEYFLFLSRVALILEFQSNYFQIFTKKWIGNQPLYKQEQYLWGYSRILLWYFEYNNQNQINFSDHFKSILNYLLTEQNLAPGYKQNAFLTLIYLLTFREPSLARQFCEPESQEYKLAERVIEKYKDEPVRLKVIGNKPLDEYFEELLKYQSSQKEIGKLVELANKS